MLAWEIPQADWDTLTVKTTRLVPGTQRYEILRSDLPSNWSLEQVAQDFGPGTYRIVAGAGPYRGLNTTVTVSGPYARSAGWEPAPAMPPATPSPLDQQAARTFMEATRGPVDPVNLAAMIQTAVDNALQRAQPKTETADAFTLIMKGFELATTMTSRSLETAKGMLGVPAAEASRSWADVALELGPSLLGTLQQMMAAPKPQSPQQHQPTIATTQAPPPPPQEAQPMTPQLPPPPPDTVPLLQIMKQYAPMLRGHLESAIPADALAAQLAGLLGADLDPSVHAVAAHVREYGPALLAHAAPYLATEKAAQVMGHWSDLLNAQEPDPGE